MKLFSDIKHHSTIAAENIKPKSEAKQESIEGCIAQSFIHEPIISCSIYQVMITMDRKAPSYSLFDLFTIAC